ncbi:MAG TPA: GNAT family N-acetyltransferase [Thermomicrobiales bacterium]|nr:GNAT family N-acetyltransferase [Thermomicrobiales bacterium]HRA31718.1 GNAT family N-acetyltransferase [Thermomicrobiales bacterium]
MIWYTSSTEGIAPEDLVGFFVGWPNPPTPETHLRLLRGSDEIILARDGESDHDGPVVGFITAIADGVLAAYIPLLEVLPEYQEQGLGGELTRRMLDRLSEYYMIDLLCDAELQPFYDRFGLRRATGMLARNYERQAGRPDEAGR